MAPDDDDNIIA